MHLFLRNLYLPNIIFPSIIVDGHSFAITFPIRMSLVEIIQTEYWYKVPLLELVAINYRTKDISWVIKSKELKNLGQITNFFSGNEVEFEPFFDGMTTLMMDGVRQKITNEQFYSELLKLLQEYILPFIPIPKENFDTFDKICKQQEQIIDTLEKEMDECTIQFKEILEDKKILFTQMNNEDLLKQCSIEFLRFLVDDVTITTKRDLNVFLQINASTIQNRNKLQLISKEHVLKFMEELNKIQEQISFVFDSKSNFVENTSLVKDAIEKYKKHCETQQTINEKLVASNEMFNIMWQLQNTSLKYLHKLQNDENLKINKNPFLSGKMDEILRHDTIEKLLNEQQTLIRKHTLFCDSVKTKCEIIRKHQHLWYPTYNNNEYLKLREIIFHKHNSDDNNTNVDESLEFDKETENLDAEICEILKDKISLEETNEHETLGQSVLKIKNPNMKNKNCIISSSMFLREFKIYIYKHIDNFISELDLHNKTSTNPKIDKKIMYNNYEIHCLNAIFPSLLTIYNTVYLSSWEKMKLNMTKMTNFTIDLPLLKHLCKNPFHNHKIEDCSSLYCQYVQGCFKHTIEEIENLASASTFSIAVQSLQEIINILGLELCPFENEMVQIIPMIHLILIHCQPYFIHKLYIIIKCLINFPPPFLNEGKCLYALATFNVALAYYWSDLLVFNRLQC